MSSRILFVVAVVLMAGMVKAQVASSEYHTLRMGLPHIPDKLNGGEQIRIAYLGGSITYNGGWRDSLNAYFEKNYPKVTFDFINAGIPSMGSTPSAFRLGRDVLSKGKIDLLFVEAAVNDATNGRTDLEQQRALEGIFRQATSVNPDVDIVLMHFVDPDKMYMYRQGLVPQVIQNHELVAMHYQVPSMNLAKEVTARIDAKEFSWEKDFINLHPSPFGQGIYARSMIDFLQRTLQESYPSTTMTLPQVLVPGCYDAGKIIGLDQARIAKGWQMVDPWSPEEGQKTRPGYTNVPFLVARAPNEPIVLEFEGDAVGIAVATGLDAGIIDYRIDGGTWQRQNLYTRWSAILHLPWYYTLAAGLPQGKHFLEVKVSAVKDSRSTGHACRIRHFYVNGR